VEVHEYRIYWRVLVCLHGRGSDDACIHRCRFDVSDELFNAWAVADGCWGRQRNKDHPGRVLHFRAFKPWVMHNMKESLARALTLLERPGERQQPRVVTVQARQDGPEFLLGVEVRSVLCSSMVRHGDEGCVCGCWTKTPSAPRTERNPSLRRGTREAVRLLIDACMWYGG
jgi:hypothetical protein